MELRISSGYQLPNICLLKAVKIWKIHHLSIRADCGIVYLKSTVRYLYLNGNKYMNKKGEWLLRNRKIIFKIPCCILKAIT